MAINKPLFYTGMAATVAALSTVSVFCAKIESTRTKLENTFSLLAQERDRVASAVRKSSGSPAKSAEKAFCDAMSDSCEKTLLTNIGPRLESVGRTTTQSCDPLPGRPYEICGKINDRILAGIILPYADEYAECERRAAECYALIR